MGTDSQGAAQPQLGLTASFCFCSSPKLGLTSAFTMIKIVVALSLLGLAQAQVSCGTHTMAVGDTLTVQSENHPDKYPRNHACAWEITCDDPKSQIEFECSQFQLQNSNGCRKDYLEISDSTGVLSTACRKDVPTGILTAINTLSLNFVSNDDTIRKPGFSCDATCVNHCGKRSEDIDA